MSIFYPIQLFADWLTYSIFGIIHGTLLASAINFFIFDTIKIILLLVVIIFVISITRSFLPPEKIRNILSHEKKYVGNILASLLGIITPFCSCSAVPLFLGFVQAGVPIGTTFSFLVASPMINEVALVLLLGMFGWKIALIYIISGLLIAIFSGMDIVKKVWLYVVVGVGLGAWIHGYVPADFLAQYAGSDKWYAVPLAVLIGIPLYSNAAGVIPLVGALTEKGVAMGTSLAFMMAVTALSLPEFMILKKIMKPKLILIFASIVGAGIIFTGFLFNSILGK